MSVARNPTCLPALPTAHPKPTNDAVDKAHFDAICSCAHFSPTCPPGWIDWNNAPANSLVRSATSWAPLFSSATGALVAKQLVVGYDNGATAAIATWDGANWTNLASGITGTIDALL